MILVLSLSTLAVGCVQPLAPEGFEPASRECASLVGDYALPDQASARLVLPQLALEGVDDWSTLSIEPDPAGALRAVLRRPAAKVGDEALQLRKRSPERYQAWRTQVRIQQGDEPVPVGVAIGDGVIASLGPTVASIGRFQTQACDGGWLGIGRPDSEHAATRSLARDAQGALLVRVDRYRQKDTGVVLFGHRMSRSEFVGRSFSRLETLPPNVPTFRLPTRDAPLVDHDALRDRRDAAAMDASVALRTWLDARRTSDMVVSILRPLHFDPNDVALAPDQVRIEVAGTYRGDAEPDPYQVILGGHPDLARVDVRKREPRSGGKHYTLMRLTLTVPADRDAGGARRASR